MLSLAIIGAGPSSLSLVTYLLSNNANESDEFRDGTLCSHVPLNDLSHELLNTHARPKSSTIPDRFGKKENDYINSGEFQEDLCFEVTNIREQDANVNKEAKPSDDVDSCSNKKLNEGSSCDRDADCASKVKLVDEMEENGEIKVFDSNGTWMQEWNNLFESFNIPTLRSPHGSHPAPTHPMSLLALATYKKEEETSLFQLKATKKLHHGIHVVPSTKLFKEFCHHVVERWTPESDILVHAKVIDVEVLYTKDKDQNEIDTSADGNKDMGKVNDHYFKITIDEIIQGQIQRKYVFAKRVVFAGGSRQTYNMPTFPVSVPINSDAQESKLSNCDNDPDSSSFSCFDEGVEYLDTDASSFYADIRKTSDIFNNGKNRADGEVGKVDNKVRKVAPLNIPQSALRHAWHIYEDLPSCKESKYEEAKKSVSSQAEKIWDDNTRKMHGVKSSNHEDNLLRFSDRENRYYSASEHKLRLGSKDVMVTGKYKNHGVIEKVNLAAYHQHEDYQFHLVDKCLFKNTMQGALSNTLEGEKILIIGGGLTSTHLCKTAFLHGCTDIILIVRTQLNVKQFDNSNSWLDNRTRKKRLALFRAKTIQERMTFINDVHFPTSITPEASMVLDNLIEAGVVKVFEDTIVSDARYKNPTTPNTSFEDESKDGVCKTEKSHWEVELMDVFTGKLLENIDQQNQRQKKSLSSLTVSERIKRKESREKKCAINKKKNKKNGRRHSCCGSSNDGEIDEATQDKANSTTCNEMEYKSPSESSPEDYLYEYAKINCKDPRKQLFHRIWCATGDNMDFRADPILSRLHDQIPVTSHRNMPILTENCRWLPEAKSSRLTPREQCHSYTFCSFRKSEKSAINFWIMGSFAALILGPDAYNLTGSRRATCLIAEDIKKSVFRARHSSKIDKCQMKSKDCSHMEECPLKSKQAIEIN